jgi:hypothetical protein
MGRFVEQVAAGAEIHQDDAAAGFAHYVLRFDIAMQQAGLMHSRQCAAQCGADPRGFLGAKRPFRRDQGIEPAPLDQLHPQADLPVDHVRAVHRHHVLVTDAREQTRFRNDLSGQRGGDGRAQELERDFPLQPRIQRAVHVPEAPFIERVENQQRSPSDRVGRRRDRHGWCRVG